MTSAADGLADPLLAAGKTGDKPRAVPVSWLVAVLGLGLLVLLHELGHFSVALLVGIKPRALHRLPARAREDSRNGIEYQIGAIPLGGYVRQIRNRRSASCDPAGQLAPIAQIALSDAVTGPQMVVQSGHCGGVTGKGLIQQHPVTRAGSARSHVTGALLPIR